MTARPASRGSLAQARTFLFLQGPISFFFRRLGRELRGRGHRVLHVNLNIGDVLLWSGEGVRGYFGRERDWPGWIGALMDREGVTDLVLLGEQRPLHKAAIEQAGRRGLRVTVTDFGYLRPDWIVLERDGMNALSHFPRDPAVLRERARGLPTPDQRLLYRDSFLNQAVLDVAYHLLGYFLFFTFPFHRTHQPDNPVRTYLGTGWRLWRARANAARAAATIEAVRASGAPAWLFAMQMEKDYSLSAYSDFPNMTAALKAVIASFAKHAPPNGRLIVKLHPLDPGLRRWDRHIAAIAGDAGVAGRVKFIDGGDLASLFAFVRGVVTVNSTLGISALRSGKPVIALGQAIYRLAGMTFEANLDAFWAEGTPPDPGLVDAFVRLVSAEFQLRGVYYSEPGLSAAARAAAERLDRP